MKKRLKDLCTLAAIILVSVLLIDYFHVSGKELSFASEVSDELVITVEVLDETGTQIQSTHTLNGLALKARVMKTHYLRPLIPIVRAKPGENIYQFRIPLPSGEILLRSVGGRSLSGPDGLLLIPNSTNWENLLRMVLFEQVAIPSVC